MTLLQDALHGRTLEDPDDPLLHLTHAAAGARTPQALWQEVADVLRTGKKRPGYRGMDKITAHCLLSVLTMQAKAMVQIEASEGLRDCLRKVA